MAQATAAQVAEMDRVQEHVEALLVKAEGKALAIEGKSKYFRSDLEKASLNAIRSARLRFTQWADAQEGLKRWALDGHREGDGTPYTPQEWADYGEELGGLMAEEVGFLDKYKYTLKLDGVLESPGRAADFLAGLPKSFNLNLSLGTKLALGGVLGVVGLGFLAWGAASLAPLFRVAERTSGEGRE